MKALEVSSHAVISLKNILFATDFSEASQAALPYAAAISRRYGSQLHVVHMVSPASYLIPYAPDVPSTIETMHDAAREDARERMETLASQLTPAPYRTYIRDGEVWEGLSEIIRTQEIDLLVVGTHGRTGVEKLILGSKAEEILRQAPCPVLTVGSKVSGRAKLPSVEGEGKHLTPVDISLRQIVYATDFSLESLAAAPFATSLAQEFQARLTLLHVIEKIEDLDATSRPIDSALQRLESLVPAEASLWCSTKPSVQFGPAAERIVQAALDARADVIVLGVRAAARHLGAATHLPWATAHKVIAHAHCPVLTIPFTAAPQVKKTKDGFYEFAGMIP
jgi:nucleotide-binding universal stress UspA family protein